MPHLPQSPPPPAVDMYFLSSQVNKTLEFSQNSLNTKSLVRRKDNKNLLHWQQNETFGPTKLKVGLAKAIASWKPQPD
jgi:hypothetical protein